MGTGAVIMIIFQQELKFIRTFNLFSFLSEAENVGKKYEMENENVPLNLVLANC